MLGRHRGAGRSRSPNHHSHDRAPGIRPHHDLCRGSLSLVSQTDSIAFNGHTSVKTFTLATRQIVASTPEGRVFTTRLDSLGQILSMQAGDLDSISFTYDSFGRISEQRQGARTITYQYDSSNGRVISVTDPLGRITRFGYDSAARITTHIRPDSNVVALSYDSAGRLISLLPPGDSAYRFQYSPVGLLQEYDPPGIPGSKPTKYFLNLDGQLDSIVRPDSVTISWAYDSAGRTTGISFDRGTMTFGYSSTTGNLIKIRAPTGDSLVFTYDGSVPTQYRWAGAVHGSVGLLYDSDYRVRARGLVKKCVNGIRRRPVPRGS
jgi:YD repeat-containing protein